MNTTKQLILAYYGLGEAERIGGGMEAEVYALGADAVLKLYGPSTPLAVLERLQGFYAWLNGAGLPYAVPRIRQLEDSGSYRVTLEARLSGEPLADLLVGAAPQQLDRLFECYVDAALALGRVPMPSATTGYLLFDPDELGTRADCDWHQFLRRWLAHQLRQTRQNLARDVVALDLKLGQLGEHLREPYRGAYRLVHGDFFPGNLLVAPDGRALGLLDFGRLTMYGDPLFDAATAWVFFDMYDELRANVRERLLPVFLDRLGAHFRGRLFRYVLLYSLLTANLYAPDCSDGHYAWCVANLNTAVYWKQLA